MIKTLSEQVAELEAERDEPKRQVEAWEHAEWQATVIPRIITAEELREGQRIALLEGRQVMYTGELNEVFPGGSIGILEAPSRRAVVVNPHEPGRTIVLLADAPEPAEDSPKWR